MSAALAKGLAALVWLVRRSAKTVPRAFRRRLVAAVGRTTRQVYSLYDKERTDRSRSPEILERINVSVNMLAKGFPSLN